MSIRHGEKETTHFRSERLENLNGKWYFAVREQVNLIGPFDSKEAARHAAEAYMKDILSGRSDINALSNQYLRRAFSLK
ncbi:DUF6316 family protein [Porticoccus sp.]